MSLSTRQELTLPSVLLEGAAGHCASRSRRHLGDDHLNGTIPGKAWAARYAEAKANDPQLAAYQGDLA